MVYLSAENKDILLAKKVGFKYILLVKSFKESKKEVIQIWGKQALIPDQEEHRPFRTISVFLWIRKFAKKFDKFPETSFDFISKIYLSTKLN